MKQLVIIFCLLLLAPLQGAVATDSPAPVSGSSVSVTPNIINARLREIEASTEMDENIKASLVELYRRALSNLEKEHANEQAATAFSKARKTSPGVAKSARDKLEKLKQKPPPVTLDVSEKTTLAEIEQKLLNEKANQAAVGANLGEIEKKLDEEAGRPTVIRQRLAEARSRQEKISTELKQLTAVDEQPQILEARQWSLIAEQMALSAEIKMLDQELLSQPMRLELLKVQQEKTEYTLKRIQERVKLFEELVSQKRRTEAEQARVEAEVAKAEMAGKHPVVQELAEKNAVLTDRLTSMSAELEKITSKDQSAIKTAKRIEDELRSTRQKLEVAGLSQVLGRVLLEQRRLLPDVRTIRREASIREDLIAAAALNQIQDNEELKRLRNIKEYIDELTSALPPEEVLPIQQDLQDLVETRRDLLRKASSLNEAYLRALGELDFGQNRLQKAIETYDAFLAERLLWIRSASLPSIDLVMEIPAQVYDLLALHHWALVGQVLVSRFTHSPVLVLVLIVFTVLLVKSGSMRQALLQTGKKIIKASTDQFSYTLQAFGLTLLLAAPWPLLFGAIGWQLSIALESTDFIKGLSHALILMSPAFFYLKAFYIICTPGGLAAAHFHWPEGTTRALRRELRILMFTFIPTGLVAIMTIRDTSVEFGGGLGRIAFVAMVIALSYFFYRLFSPGQSTLHDMHRQRPRGILSRFRILWFVFSLLVPASLVILAVSGFLYTAGVLTGSLIDTLWLVLGFIIVYQLAVRWLLMVRRKLALEAVLERRRAAMEAGEREAVESSDTQQQYHVENPEIDLTALNEESLKLLNTTLIFLALIGLWFIWSDVLPAFGMLNDISLWHYKGTVDGEEQIIPVSLADLILAVLVLIVTVVASKRFPALLEIILLRRFSTTSGGRYAATTLSRYTIAAIGTLFSLNIIGASWSQVQWLAAALSVGIGFGLQEIVANFISGIIILFERPIRVGDVVTVGDTDGVVTRIQIRATTIRTWDRLELLVPNKEFITGRLLNWSLSDQTTRIKIPVGIAYGSDVGKAMSLLSKVAEENEAVLNDPKPSIIFEAFGDNSLNLVLRCFVGVQDDRMPTLTALHNAINDRFNEAGIEIAFPQRDVHLDTSQPLDIRISQA